MTTEVRQPVVPPAPQRRRGPRGWVVVAVVVALVVGGGIAAGLVLSGGSSTPTLGSEATAQLTSVQTACQQWLDTNPSQPGTAQWCRQMANWMSQDIERNDMGPQMMWGSHANLESACEQWMGDSPPSGSAGTDAHDWCDAMVSWMSADVGNWSGRSSWGSWMRHGPMFGGAPGNGAPASSTSESTTGSTGPGSTGPGSMGPGSMGQP